MSFPTLFLTFTFTFRHPQCLFPVSFTLPIIILYLDMYPRYFHLFPLSYLHTPGSAQRDHILSYLTIFSFTTIKSSHHILKPQASKRMAIHTIISIILPTKSVSSHAWLTLKKIVKSLHEYTVTYSIGNSSNQMVLPYPSWDKRKPTKVKVRSRTWLTPKDHQAVTSMHGDVPRRNHITATKGIVSPCFSQFITSNVLLISWKLSSNVSFSRSPRYPV
jgi:hypothetical protein